MSMQLTNDEAIRLARIIAANFDLAVLATILIKRPKNSDAVVKIILPAIPGATLKEKVAWAITNARPAFDSEARFRVVVAELVAALKLPQPAPDPVPETPEAPPASGSALTGQETGFLWKPIGENSKKLRVLLPSSFTNKINRRSVELWAAGKKLETGSTTGVANGNREHFAFSKQGSGYPANVQVRATADGIVWVWTVPNPAVRTENLKASRAN